MHVEHTIMDIAQARIHCILPCAAHHNIIKHTVFRHNGNMAIRHSHLALHALTYYRHHALHLYVHIIVHKARAYNKEDATGWNRLAGSYSMGRDIAMHCISV